ncbi:MAG: type II secretion system F family protein [Clostridiales bacterium]|nr:type II secretion system F family protein [Clostridiales bacterium]
MTDALGYNFNRNQNRIDGNVIERRVEGWREFLGDMDLSSYRTRRFLALGLFLLDRINPRFASAYSRRLLSALGELYGVSEASKHMRVHLAEKINLLLVSLASGTVIWFAAHKDKGFAVFILLFAVGLFFLLDREVYQKVRKRRLELKRDFPDFVNKLALLVNAGMLVSKAWEKASEEGRQASPLYRELRLSVLEIRSGETEYRAFEAFAKRCRIPEISRFVSLILQNLRKGSNELVPLMRLYANDCWEMRKNLARKYGEEASTKLIFPMMLMFLAVLLIVGTPAVLALKGI